MNLFALIGRRLAISVVVLLVVSILVFAGTEILPGDVAYAILGQSATPELVALIRDRLGLDDPARRKVFAMRSEIRSEIWAGAESEVPRSPVSNPPSQRR